MAGVFFVPRHNDDNVETVADADGGDYYALKMSLGFGISMGFGTGPDARERDR